VQCTLVIFSTISNGLLLFIPQQICIVTSDYLLCLSLIVLTTLCVSIIIILWTIIKMFQCFPSFVLFLQQQPREVTHCQFLSPGATLFEILFYRINKESIIDVEGEVKLAAQKVQSCSQEDVEVFVDKVSLSKNF